MSQWLAVNWFNLLQSFAIVSSLLFTAYTLRITIKNQRVANLFQITQYHREIWSLIISKPELHRIFKETPNLEQNPITEEERLVVSLLILHLSCTFEATKAGAIVPIEGLRADIKDFFNYPIPHTVWGEMRQYQNTEFRRFIESEIGDLIVGF